MTYMAHFVGHDLIISNILMCRAMLEPRVMQTTGTAWSPWSGRGQRGQGKVSSLDESMGKVSSLDFLGTSIIFFTSLKKNECQSCTTDHA